MRHRLVFILALVTLSCDNTTSVEPLSGVQGHVTMSPICPVEVSQDPNCEPAPLAAELEVRDADGMPVARVTSDAEGWYRVALAPGHYSLNPLAASPPSSFPTPPPPVEVDVQLDMWTTVDLDYDTGIR